MTGVDGAVETRHIDTYKRDGLVAMSTWFSRAEIAKLHPEIDALEMDDQPGRIVERTGEPNSIYITPRYPRLYAFAVQPRLVRAARALLGGDVYMHQAKLNSKVAFRGSAVEWHRDFDFWNRLDGMPQPAALTAAVFVDAVDVHNAPLLVIPGSHERGACGGSRWDDPPVDPAVPGAGVGSWTNAKKAGASTVVGDLKYVTDEREIVDPIVALTGETGTTVFFHSKLIHGSSCNMSPRGRRMFFISFNRTSNPLRPVRNPRPPYIANRDFTALALHDRRLR